ncbi:MAG: cobalamin biosynthesis protein CbiM [Deltaproteobacteria bacterium RIFOXYD12_FULL_57_12]|nr:MAG: cobalamin biosynthesis protein CbiM [Deltaproteobacteria bacterium RIFOXYD12_FULL_57_12]
MHMADALLSPVVGGAMWTTTAGIMAYSARRIRKENDDYRIPLMGVLGAFVFAAQMINFSIPGTGSSGHLGGGMLLTILLGPHAAFLVIASVLTVQALFFGDGGLLALGCNIFNLGFFPCFVAYPFVYRVVVKDNLSSVRLNVGAVLAAVLSLQLGAFGVVLETTFSGITELPFISFLLAMQPIHLAIGIVEGLVTAGVVSFIWKAQPEILQRVVTTKPFVQVPVGKICIGLAVMAAITGGIFSWFASQQPDGLEWSMSKVAGKEELDTAEHGIQAFLGHVQNMTALLPDYGFKDAEKASAGETSPARKAEPIASIDAGTTLSGLLGGTITFLLAVTLGLVLKKRTPQT